MTTPATATDNHAAKPKGGAPRGNRNAKTRHGVRGYLALGRMPAGASYVRKLVFGLRKHLEATIIDQHGEINVYRAALVQSSCRHEARAQLLTRWLRTDEGLKLPERLAVLKEIGAASDSRDRCLERLGLNVDAKSDPWAMLALPSRVDAQDAASGTQGDEGESDAKEEAADATGVDSGDVAAVQEDDAA